MEAYMNLLFVLSQKELTGAETYAVSLIKELTDRNHKVVIVSDTLNSKIDIPYYSLDIDNRKSFINRIRHIKSLCQLIKQEKINLLHAHSRASSWVAYFASQTANIPLITTAHCIYPVHLSSRLFPCFGKKVIAVCGAARDHLITQFGINSRDILLIPNGIDTDHFRSQRAGGVKEQEILVSWIGRFSGPRGRLLGEMVEKVFPVVRKAVPNLRFLIVAGGNRPLPLEKKVSAINAEFSCEVIRFTGFSRDIPNICASSALVIGAGRVALEAMACERAVISIGENQLIGLINPETIEQGIYTNFGDCCSFQPVDWVTLTSAIVEVLKNEKKADELGKWGREVVIDQFDLKKVANKVEKLYETLAG
jgi:glycosyltransferase involved in cell wall biosynthesis